MGKKSLEVFKFSLYLLIPVATVFFFNSPEAIKALIEWKRYIVYPPEGPPPPKTREEIEKALGIKPGDRSTVSNKPMQTESTQLEPQKAEKSQETKNGSSRKKWFGIF